MGEKIGWDPPDLNEFETMDSGFTKRKSNNPFVFLVGLMIGMVALCLIAQCDMTDKTAKIPSPPDRSSVSADARYP